MCCLLRIVCGLLLLTIVVCGVKYFFDVYSCIQVQAGLLFVDAANITMRETFFRPWADCANNDDCLIPDDIHIRKGTQLTFLKNYTIEGHRVFRCGLCHDFISFDTYSIPRHSRHSCMQHNNTHIMHIGCLHLYICLNFFNIILLYCILYYLYQSPSRRPECIHFSHFHFLWVW